MKLQDKFIGTWKLIDWYLISKVDKKNYPFGQQPKGYLIYLPNGLMSVHLMASNRQQFTSEGVFDATPEEALNALNTYASYCGKYTIEGNAVKHHIELVSIPNWVNTIQTREFEFQENHLILRNKLWQNGEEQSSEIIWQRY